MLHVLTVSRRLTSVWVAAACCWALVGCTGGERAPDSCTQVQTSALFGADQAWPEGIDAKQAGAIGSVELDGGEVVCSASLVAAGYAITARHCNRPGRLWFRPSGTSTAGRSLVRGTVPHASLDLMLLELELSNELHPPVIEMGAIGAGRVGEEVLLAGLGEVEGGERGSLLFVREPIVALTEDHLVVDGKGRTGACGGDSGGPLLDLNAGELRLLGVLSYGEASCVGKDYYVHVGAFGKWLRSTLSAAHTGGCLTASHEGTCDARGARWCDGNTEKAQVCKAPMGCGYDVDALGFRCVAPEDDSCAGVGQHARCDGSRIVRCDEGMLRAMQCSDCGLTCVVDPGGQARCG